MGRYMWHGLYRLYKCVGLLTRPRKNPKSAAFLYFARRSQRQADEVVDISCELEGFVARRDRCLVTNPCPSGRALCAMANFETVAARILEEHRIVTRSFVIAGPFDRARAGAAGDLGQTINL